MLSLKAICGIGLGSYVERECVCVCVYQAIINSTITPNMTFTKTSHKFGQWADSRANTVYGLGFSTEQQLQQVGGDTPKC